MWEELRAGGQKKLVSTMNGELLMSVYALETHSQSNTSQNKTKKGQTMNDPKENPTQDYNEALNDILKAMQERNRQLSRVIESLNRIANRI